MAAIVLFSVLAKISNINCLMVGINYLTQKSKSGIIILCAVLAYRCLEGSFDPVTLLISKVVE